MERLTKISEIGNAYYPKCFEEPCCGMGECLDDKCSLMLDACKKLAEYEQLEEQGLLVKFPCKIGDTVYVKLSAYCKTKYAEAQVRDYTHFISCGFCVVVTSEKFDKQSIPFSEFGKTVFLTREEAEKKLEEMKK